MKRDRAVWYYRRGGETHGPVSWAEIERVGAEDERLRVARAGDESWSTIAEVREQHPGLAIAGESRWRVIASADEDAETSDEVGERDWQETEDDEQDWIPHEASGAGRKPRRMPHVGMRPEPGVGTWLRQAGSVVFSDPASFVLAGILASVISSVTMGIAAPAMIAGMFILAIRKYRGDIVSATDVVDGFAIFIPALIVLAVEALVGGAPIAGIMALLDAAGLSDGLVQIAGAAGAFVTWTFVGAALFWALPLVADRGLGGIEAIVASWEITRERYWLYVGLQVIVLAIGYLGGLTCLGWVIAMPYMSAFVACAYAWRFSEDYAGG